MDQLLIAFVTTAATLFVTIALFAVEYVRRWVGESRRRRELIVDRVLTTVERATRSASRAPLSDLWAPSQLDYALLLPRLLADVPAKDRAIAMWVGRQVQLQRQAPSRKAALEVGLGIATTLVHWSHRERKREWFKQENERDPWVPGRSIPRRTKFRRLLHDTWDWARFALAMSAVAMTVRGVGRTLP